MSEGNGNENPVNINCISKATLQNMQQNQQEILRIAVRLCELVPAGASLLFNLDVAKGPQLVTSGGAPVGKVFELVQINRPIAYIQQEAKLGTVPR